MHCKPRLPLLHLFATAIALALPVVITAQTTPAVTPPAAHMPTDQNAQAHALLASTLKINGLTAIGLQPWHLKATYQIFQTNLAPGTGTVEVWWASPNQWRRFYTSKTYAGTEWSVKRIQRYQTSEPFLHDFLELRVAKPLTNPLFQAVNFKPDVEIGIKPLAAGTQLNCLQAVDRPPSKTNQDDLLFPTYCVDKSAILRMVAISDTAVSFSAYKAFNNRAIATRVDVRVNGQPVSSMQITQLDTLDPADTALLVPAKDAMPEPWTIPYGEPPLVPTHVEEAAVVGLSTSLLRGQVRTSIVVHKDGSVQLIGRPAGQISQIDGHRVIIGNVIDAVAYAVAKSRFEPYVVDGQTVEVATTLVYVFDGKPFQGLIDISAPHLKDDVATPAPNAKK